MAGGYRVWQSAIVVFMCCMLASPQKRVHLCTLANIATEQATTLNLTCTYKRVQRRTQSYNLSDQSTSIRSVLTEFHKHPPLTEVGLDTCEEEEHRQARKLRKHSNGCYICHTQVRLHTISNVTESALPHSSTYGV